MDEFIVFALPAALLILYISVVDFRKLFYLEYGGGGFFKQISTKVFFSFRWLLYILFNYRTY